MAAAPQPHEPPTTHQLAELIRTRGPGTGTAPYVVGIGGPVAVGKSTLAGELARALTGGDPPCTVEVVATDGFLLPNERLDALGLTFSKGAPETYDVAAIVELLEGFRAGRDGLRIPEYSHVTYDVEPGEGRPAGDAQVVVIEGLNVLTVERSVADHLDLGVFVTARPEDLERWFVDRFMSLREAARTDPSSFFAQFVELDDSTALTIAEWTWNEMNRPVAEAHVLPAMARADVVVELGPEHQIEGLLIRPA